MPPGVRGYHMSFKEWSAAQTAKADTEAEQKTAAVKPVAQAAVKSTDGAAKPKS